MMISFQRDCHSLSSCQSHNYSFYDFYSEIIFDNHGRFNFLLSRDNSALIDIGNKIKNSLHTEEGFKLVQSLMRKLYKSLSRRAFTFFNYKDKWHASVARINISKGNKVKWSNFSVRKLLTFQRLSVFSSASAVPSHI